MDLFRNDKLNVIANKVKQSFKMKLLFNRLLCHSFGIPLNDKLKKVFLLIALLFSINSFSQEKPLKYKEYSYSQFFKLLENEKDTIFTLEDAIIRFDIKTDSMYGGTMSLNNQESNYFRKDSITIYKQLVFKNVQFLAYHLINKGENEFPDAYASGFHNFLFKKKVSFQNCLALSLSNAVFEESVAFSKTKKIESIYNYFTNVITIKKVGLVGPATFSDLSIKNTHFKNGVSMDYDIYEVNKELKDFNLTIENCDITYTSSNLFESSNILISNIGMLEIINSKFDVQDLSITAGLNYNFILKNNLFKNKMRIDFTTRASSNGITIESNTFLGDVRLRLEGLSANMNIDWEQWHDKIISDRSFFDFVVKFRSQEKYKNMDLLKLQTITNSDSVYAIFKNEYYLKNKNSLKREFKLRSKYVQFYRDQFEFDNANLVYLEYKDIETKKTQLKYQENPTFDNFFTWKINQFLKVFSAYGTKPSKAIIFSMYVILLFAFIYLLFPNSWDSHGKKRLMHRFEFFQKYLRRNEGIHTIYLEGKEQEISSFNDFKNKLDDEKLELPAFFISWSKPLYNASMFSSKLMTRFLKTTDVLTGKWKDLSPKQKRWKNIQIGVLLILGLLYDILIKMLNALMLSINTFTTLGFGEIPIKGLPRYLAIIQGFIGWFMLTIFSVSLISQLLN